MEIVERLKSIAANRVSTNETVLEHHSKTLTYHSPSMPDVVVFPKTEKEIREVVVLASETNMPIVPFGVGTSLEGQTIPYYGGIMIDFSEMNNILEIEPEDFTVTVQPGVTREQLNLALKKYGLFFPIDPGANATIGGMTATNASGTNAVKYGTMRQQVKKLRVVMANGEVMTVGSNAVKSSAGYALKDLFIGSEGTLGIFSEITLKVYGIEEADAVMKIAFDSIEKASEAAYQVLASGLKVTKMELIDASTIAIVNTFSSAHLKEMPSLFIEVSGSKQDVDGQVQYLQELAVSWALIEIQMETDSILKAKLWEARHHAGLAIAAANKGKLLMSTDVCVPISKLSEAIHHARTVVDEKNVNASIFGHVGDGNFHVVLAVNPEDKEELAAIKAINNQIVQFALENNGSCTGEHGIGIGKREFLKKEHETSYKAMLAIKRLFDPQCIFSPGVLFESTRDGDE